MALVCLLHYSLFLSSFILMLFMPLQIGFVSSCCVSTLLVFILYGRGYKLLGLHCFLLSFLWFCFFTPLCVFCHWPCLISSCVSCYICHFFWFGFSSLHAIPVADTLYCSLFLSIMILLQICILPLIYILLQITFPCISLSLGVSLGYYFFSVFFLSFLVGLWALLFIGPSSSWAFGYRLAKTSINNIFDYATTFIYIIYIYIYVLR